MPKTKQRPAPVSVRFSEEERTILARLSEIRHLPPSRIVRLLVYEEAARLAVSVPPVGGSE